MVVPVADVKEKKRTFVWKFGTGEVKKLRS